MNILEPILRSVEDMAFTTVPAQVILLLSIIPQGNKKGPIKRWDFETEEDYHSYMESREALPKLVKFDCNARTLLCLNIVVIHKCTNFDQTLVGLRHHSPLMVIVGYVAGSIT